MSVMEKSGTWIGFLSVVVLGVVLAIALSWSEDDPATADPDLGDPPTVDFYSEVTLFPALDQVPIGSMSNPASFTAIFYAEDDTTSPEDLSYTVQVANVQHILNGSPTNLFHESYFQDGRLWIRVSAEFDANVVTSSAAQLDIIVGVEEEADGVVQSGTSTMTVTTSQ